MVDAVGWRSSTHEWVAVDRDNRVIAGLAGEAPTGAAVMWMCRVAGIPFHHLIESGTTAVSSPEGNES